MAYLNTQGTMYDYPGSLIEVPSEDPNVLRKLLSLLLRGQSAVYFLHGGVTTVDLYGSIVVKGISYALKLTATIANNSDRDDFTLYTFNEEWTNGFTFESI